MKNERPLAGGEEARVSIGPDSAAFSTLTPSDATIVDRHVVITGGLNNLYCVTVQPPLDGHGPQIFDSHKKARGFAGGLRLSHRWPIVDETGGGQ